MGNGDISSSFNFLLVCPQNTPSCVGPSHARFVTSRRACNVCLHQRVFLAICKCFCAEEWLLKVKMVGKCYIMNTNYLYIRKTGRLPSLVKVSSRSNYKLLQIQKDYN